MMSYMSKIGLKEENIKLKKELEVTDVAFKEYTYKVFRYDEELKSIKHKLAVNTTVEKIKNNVLDIKEIEQFINFSDLNKCSLDDQNKYLLEIIHSLFEKIDEKEKIKKDILIGQKNIKHFNECSQVIDLSKERNKIDLIEEENFNKSNKSFLSLNKSLYNSNSCIDLIDVSNNSSSISNQIYSHSNTVIEEKNSPYLKDFTNFNQKLKKTRNQEISSKNLFLGKKIERKKEKFVQNSILNFIK